MIEIVRAAVGGYEPRRSESGGAREAAVLIALYEHGGRHHVVLTKRSDKVEHHKGEISFPGGAHDPTDADLAYTALREAHEEIGLHPRDVEVLGEIDQFVTQTGFRITPFVGLIRRTPYVWSPAVDEVAHVLEIPVDRLLSPEVFRQEYVEHRGQWYNHLTYTWEGHLVWGATANMLTQFLDLLRQHGLRA